MRIFNMARKCVERDCPSKPNPILYSIRWMIAVLVLVVMTIHAPKPATHMVSKSVERIYGEYMMSPVYFEPNLGQADPSVEYLSRGNGLLVFLTREKIQLIAGHVGMGDPAVLQLYFDNANEDSVYEGVDVAPSESRYFIGRDRARWTGAVPHYKKIIKKALFPGVDLAFYGNQSELEFDLIVHPGAIPSVIQMKVAGEGHPEIDKGGALILGSGAGKIRIKKPVAYQEKGGSRIPVDARFVLAGKDRVSFEVGSYDTQSTLVIDPVLVYSTLLGGDSEDNAYGLAVDDSGCAYVVGSVYSLDFPVTLELQGTHGGGYGDAFISKFGPGGDTLLFSTYLGGVGMDAFYDVFLDSTRNIYVTGYSESADYPVVNPYSATPTGRDDIVVTKLNPAGDTILSSTFVGGSQGDYGYHVRLDGSGNICIAGYTFSDDFPVLGAYQPIYGGDPCDVVLFKLSSAGNSLLSSTYLGGQGFDYVKGLVIGGDGSLLVAGQTTAADFPTLGAYQSSSAGDWDGYITKLNSAGTTLLFSTYFGGSDIDCINSLDLDADGNICVIGHTTSSDLPVMNAWQNASNGDTEAFIAKFDPNAANLLFSSYLGGSSYDWGFSILCIPSGGIYVSGETNSSDFPVLWPIQDQKGGTYTSMFISKFTSGGALLHSTYFGAGRGTRPEKMRLDDAESLYVAGHTYVTDFPTYNAYQSVGGGGQDVFVVKMIEGSPVPSPTPTVHLAPSETPTASPTGTATDTPTRSPTPILTPTPSETSTSSSTSVPTDPPTASSTPTNTETLIPTETPSHTPSSTSTSTRVDSGTPGASPIGRPTWIPYPNPICGESVVVIRANLPVRMSKVQWRLFTTAMRKVVSGVWHDLPVGESDRVIDLEDDDGKDLANGLYFLVLDMPGDQIIIRLVVLR